MSLISDLAIELRQGHGGSAVEWQQAIDAAGSEQRVRWLLENAWPDRRAVAWTPDVLILAHTAARLLEDGPGGMQSVYATT
jgi:hypothetical protein